VAQKVFRSGNSLAVVIPSDFVHLLGVKPGDTVKVVTESEKGKIVYFFSGSLQMSLSEMFKKKKKS